MLGAESDLDGCGAGISADSLRSAWRCMSCSFLVRGFNISTNATLVADVSFPQAPQTATVVVTDWYGFSALVIGFEAQGAEHAQSLG